MLAAMIAGQEGEHVVALTRAIRAAGGTPVKLPKFVFRSVGHAQRRAREAAESEPGDGHPRARRDSQVLTSPSVIVARLS